MLTEPGSAPEPFPAADQPVGPSAGLGSRLGASLGATVAMTALVAVAGVLMSRLLGPDGRGRVSTATVVAVSASSLATVGVELWAMGQIARQGWPAAAAGALRRQAVLVLAACTTLAGVAAVALGGTDRTLALATVAVAAATAMMALTLAIPLGMGLPAVQAGGYLAFGATTLVLAGLLFATDRRSVALALATIAGGRAAGAAANLGLSRRERRRATARRSGPPPVADWAVIYRFGFPASIGTTLTQSIYRLDLLLLPALGTIGMAGQYAVASTATEVLWLIPDALAAVLLPHVAATRSFHDTARLVRVSGLALVAGGALVVATAPLLLPLVFGDDFRDASSALVPLVVAGVFLGSWKLLVADLTGRGDGRIRAVSVSAGVAVMLVSDLVWIPAFGIVGAGVGSALGYGVAATVAARAWRRAGGSLPELVRVRRADLTTLLAVGRRLGATAGRGGRR